MLEYSRAIQCAGTLRAASLSMPQRDQTTAQGIYWDLDGSLTGTPNSYTTWADKHLINATGCTVTETGVTVRKCAPRRWGRGLLRILLVISVFVSCWSSGHYEIHDIVSVRRFRCMFRETSAGANGSVGDSKGNSE